MFMLYVVVTVRIYNNPININDNVITEVCRVK